MNKLIVESLSNNRYSMIGVLTKNGFILTKEKNIGLVRKYILYDLGELE